MSNLDSLDNLGLKYGTDKSSKGHGYLETYEKYLLKNRNAKLAFLEIGIFNGASLRMWEEYFQNSNIYAMDIDQKKMQNCGRIKSFVANQEKREDLLKAINEIGECDVIIDDGGHTMLQQQVTFGCLFPYVKSGGIYCIEDLHTSCTRQRYGYNATNTVNTTLTVVKELAKNKDFKSDFMTDDEIAYIKNNYSYCNVEKCLKSEIVFIGKT